MKVESDNKRRLSLGLHNIPQLQVGKQKKETYGLADHHGKKRAEHMNTGHIMDDETFITHLLSSLPQSEYEGAILVIKDKLRKGPVDLPEIEQVLEDKYQALKHAKGWEEEEDDYALFASPSNKKK